MNLIPLKVAIIGAGPAGLITALALIRRGAGSVRVFEINDDHSAVATYNPCRSYSIDITGHGYRAADYVNVTSRFNKELIPFLGLRYAPPPWLYRYWSLYLTENFTGRGWTGSRGDICRALLAEILSINDSACKILFKTKAELIDFKNGILRISSIETGLTYNEHFDLIVAADGAGSATRDSLINQEKTFSVSSFDLPDHSVMLHLDQNVEELDPRYLYIHAVKPVAAISGAINGPNGSTAPLWFCQLRSSSPFSFNSDEESKSLLEKAHPLLLRYASDSSIAELSHRQSIHTGKSKRCSSLAVGRVVFLGDAGAPIPPIGQGVNAAMESAVVLDQCLEQAQKKCPDPMSVVDLARRAFNEQWEKETDALRQIAMTVDTSKSYTVRRLLLASLLGYSAVNMSKKDSLSYQQALQNFQEGERRLRLTPLRWFISG
jgi:2-polyprenyl-6-methoxyphenol hydroxylase-like FAD-dependent oxidoreductase